MSNDQDGRQSLRDFKPIEHKRGGAPLIVLGLLVICAGAGALTFKKALLDMWTSTQQNQTNNTWVLPEGTPSMGDAELCLRGDNLPCAEADMLAYLKQYPKDSHATALLAITLTRDGRHKEALYYYKKAETMGVATYDFYAGYAKTLDTLGDTDGAIAKNQAALRLVPSLVDVRGDLADELVRKGRAKEALELLTSFDDQLVSKGYKPYFTEQIRPHPTEHGRRICEGGCKPERIGFAEQSAPDVGNRRARWRILGGIEFDRWHRGAIVYGRQRRVLGGDAECGRRTSAQARSDPPRRRSRLSANPARQRNRHDGACLQFAVRKGGR